MLLAAGLVMVSCGDAGLRGHATPQAAQELADIAEQDLPALEKQDLAEPELMDAFYDVIRHFSTHTDTAYTAPDSGIGMLHLACIFKKTELVRCLLLDGADPNKHAQGDDSPLLLAVGTFLTPEASAEQMIALVDTLLAAGADFARSGHNATDFLTQAAYVCENEQVILHLLQQGAQADADTAFPLALHGWQDALRLVLQQKPDTAQLLHAAAVGSCRFVGQYRACMEMLLRHGAEVNASEPDLVGATALFRLAEELSNLPEDSPHFAQAMEALEFLLRHGADATLRVEADEEYPGFCPYDFFLMRPHLLKALEERGIHPEAPPLHFSSGVPLLAEVCRAAATPHPAEELAPHFGSIAAVLSPTPAMQQHELFPQAVEAALPLLVQTDAAKAAQCILDMPLWQQSPSEPQKAALAPLISALQNNAKLVLPKEFICQQAEKLIAAKLTDEAAGMVELLGRCPDAQQEIERYCRDELLPLQAGAYAARLAVEGLPDARNAGVADWLEAHHRQADTPFLKDAVLLTSLERLWYGDMSAQEQKAMLTLMRRIGAESAAAAYEQILRHLDDPDQLDAILSHGDDWKYELEAATARYFLEHKADFSSSTQP